MLAVHELSAFAWYVGTRGRVEGSASAQMHHCPAPGAPTRQAGGDAAPTASGATARAASTMSKEDGHRQAHREGASTITFGL
jgi:hypothetical protein